MRKPEEPPPTRPVLAEAIVAISKAVVDLRRSGLNERAIVVLTAQAAHIPQSTVRRVLRTLDELAHLYAKGD